MPFPIAALTMVFLLIAVRRVGRFSVPIWAAMGAGAVAVLASGHVTPAAAVSAIDWDVMVFLFGAFIIGDALERSGLLFHTAHRLLHGARSTDALVFRLLLAGGLSSALLMNDTLAVVGTPLVLLLAREHRLPPRLLLLTLAFAVTIGSVTSPIGNPQNLLIALHGGLEAPFISFLRHLLLPTLLNLVLTYVVLRILFRSEFHKTPLAHTRVQVSDPLLARLAGWSVGLLVALIALRVVLVIAAVPVELRLSHIALAAALPVLLFSPRRATVLRHVDWRTLVFFAAMFVLMRAVWDTGFFQGFVGEGVDLAAAPMVLTVSVLLSQLISNVPLVALYLPVLDLAGAGENALLALAAGSTIAGNLLILGAASNVIILQAAECRAGVHIGFFEFARVGVVVTAVNLAVYWLFLPG
ncbi:MAG: SLC13 family permease [Thiohalomonadaceae bacterium]